MFGSSNAAAYVICISVSAKISTNTLLRKELQGFLGRNDLRTWGGTLFPTFLFPSYSYHITSVLVLFLELWL